MRVTSKDYINAHDVAVLVSQKVKRALDEDPAYEGALAAIQRELDGKDSIEWSDVEEDITSGQWGRLIQLGILEEADNADGYVLYDETEVESNVDVSAESAFPMVGKAEDNEDDEESDWSYYDIIAVVIAGFFMLGYAYTPIRNVVGSTLHLAFGPIDAVLPFFGVIGIVATGTAVYTSVLQSRLMGDSQMQEMQEKMSKLKERRKEAKERGDEQALNRVDQQQKEMMSKYPSMMTKQFRPMLWIMTLTLPIFLWVFWVVQSGQIGVGEQTIVLPMVGETSWTDSVGPLKTWIVWYLLISLGMSQVFQKLFGIEVSM